MYRSSHLGLGRNSGFFILGYLPSPPFFSSPPPHTWPRLAWPGPMEPCGHWSSPKRYERKKEKKGAQKKKSKKRKKRGKGWGTRMKSGTIETAHTSSPLLSSFSTPYCSPQTPPPIPSSPFLHPPGGGAKRKNPRGVGRIGL